MYRALLVVTFVLLGAMALIAAGIAVWGTGEARYQLRRVELAGAVLEAHLQLKASSYELFRRLSDGVASTTPSGSEIPDEARERAAVQRAVDGIRNGIAQELSFTRSREDETSELDRLAAMERGLLYLLAQYSQARTLTSVGRGEEARAMFDEALRDLTGVGFRALFDAAIAEEERETAEAQAEAETALSRVVLMAPIVGGAAALLAGIAMLILLRRLRQPLRELMLTAQAVAAGDFGRRAQLEPGRPDEFARVAIALNAMIDEVARGRQTDADTRRGLEAAVADRTEELARANQELRRADDLRRRFLADVSHELRTPLTVIRGEAEITLRGAKSRSAEEYRGVLTRIADQAVYTGRLVDDLLFVARSEAGEPRMARKAVALDALARRCVADFQVQAGAAGVALGPVTGASDVVVEGDPGRLGQAVVILLDNALRYSEPGSRVEVAVLRSPAGAVLRVTDGGIGIDGAELPHVFDRFWRGARAVARHVEGSGLGLPLAKAIVGAHGGVISLESRPGAGTVATITLPVAQRTQAVA